MTTLNELKAAKGGPIGALTMIIYHNPDILKALAKDAQKTLSTPIMNTPFDFTQEESQVVQLLCASTLIVIQGPSHNDRTPAEIFSGLYLGYIPIPRPKALKALGLKLAFSFA